MSLTKEMIMSVEKEVELYSDEQLMIYYRSHKDLNDKHPNSFYSFKVRKSLDEIMRRGIESNLSKSW